MDYLIFFTHICDVLNRYYSPGKKIDASRWTPLKMYEASTVRYTPFDKAELTILSTTAFANEDTRRNYGEQRFNLVLIKPLDKFRCLFAHLLFRVCDGKSSMVHKKVDKHITN